MLEKYVADLELICLKELQMTMLHKHKFRRDRIVIFLVVLLILHIRERDIWRLEYWIFCASEVSILGCTKGFSLTTSSGTGGDIPKQQMLSFARVYISAIYF